MQYRRNEQLISVNLDQCPFRQFRTTLVGSNFVPSKSTVVGSNFVPSKSTVVERNFGLSKITVEDRNFGPSEPEIVDRYFRHPKLLLHTVILDNYFFFYGTVAVGKLGAV